MSVEAIAAADDPEHGEEQRQQRQCGDRSGELRASGLQWTIQAAQRVRQHRRDGQRDRCGHEDLQILADAADTRDVGEGDGRPRARRVAGAQDSANRR
jgi:hypothetical protein